jgi:uncharacterized membrane protein required for colicin V production
MTEIGNQIIKALQESGIAQMIATFLSLAVLLLLWKFIDWLD